MKFPLEREIFGLEYEGALGENEVVSEDDEIKSAQPSAAINIPDEAIEESPTKRRRKVTTPSASEDVVRRNRLRTR